MRQILVKNTNVFIVCFLVEIIKSWYVMFGSKKNEYFIEKSVMVYKFMVETFSTRIGRLVGSVYDISTIVGDLMPNTLYTIYIKYIWFGWILWHINHCR